MTPAERVQRPGFWEAFRFWLKLGFISFGGPTGQIAIMHTELVERKKWITEERFLHALNYCMLLPGPEAQQLATYVGWLMHKTKGGIVAGSLFVLPSVFILWLLSYVYVVYGSLPWVAGIFYGLKPAVLAIVVAAAFRIGKRTLRREIHWILAILAFVGLYFFHLPFPLILLAAAVVGLSASPWLKDNIPASSANDGLPLETHTTPSWSRAFRICAIGLLLWWVPVLAAGLWLGWDHTVFREGVFFSKASVITFGGAYAVLPYVSQQAVEYYGWLSAAQMLDGLALAETTPGPLIMVLQFVGFLGGWQHPGSVSPLAAGTLGALITTWTTFVPCFLFVFLGAPHIEQLRGNRTVTAALSAITAAVVGVILNLAVWFAMHTVFSQSGKVDWFACGLVLAALVALTKGKWNIVAVIVTSGGLGLIFRLFTA